MRITFLVPNLKMSGGARVVAVYAKGFSERGHHVTLVVSPEPAPPWYRRILGAILKGRAPDIHTAESDLGLGAVRIKRLKAGPSGAEPEVPDADVVIATWWATAEFAAKLEERKGKKVYLIQHHEVFDYLPRDRVESTYRFPMYQVTVSTWLFKLMREKYGSKHVYLVSNAIDPELFFADARRKQVNPTFGFVYNQTPWKGTDSVLRACELARARVPGLRVIAFGNERPTPELPLPGYCSFTHRPRQQDIRSIYASCDGWLFGSRTEGFGLPILEAMACRTPVIGTPVGAASELLENGAGFLVPVDDPASMADAICRIAQMADSEWGELSTKALQVASRFTWNASISKFEKLLVELSDS